jgi:hypothetical protein
MSTKNTVITPPSGTSKISPLGFHRYASEFAKSAQEARNALGSLFSPVSYYLYCHSLELALKAFLLAKGVEITELPQKKTLGHDLLKILHRAKMLDLEASVPLPAHWQTELQKANSYYLPPDKGFEYFGVERAVRGYPDLPSLDVLEEIVTTLLAKLERVCAEG